MKLLLDTHIWIWSVSEPQRLTRRVARELDNAQNQLWLSPVSIWETLLLHRKHRLNIPEGLSTWVTRALTTMPLNEAPLTFEVAGALSTINLAHSDPADLFLAASAKVFGLTLVTSDRNLIRAPEISVLEN
ncbi:MAG TPA: type II toxin-antitoxin system VapC family toxin [Terriglobales bacterium]|jgi:PIN domain nuclease of toxin-antitoxin system|nr:type II toxin-antitoxin system VapC family toxin [Terriglobales bacterium]